MTEWLLATAVLCSAPPSEFVKRYCLDCHQGDKPAGGANLAALPDEPQRANGHLWIRAHDRVAAGEMPPKDAAPLSASDRKTGLQELAAFLSEPEVRRRETEGRTPYRRLTRTEYERTVHALLKIDLPIAALLPEDPAPHGFDRVADGQRLSALQLERYFDAARASVDAALRIHRKPEPIKRRLRLQDEKGVRENLDTPQGKIRDQASKEKHRQLFREIPGALVLLTDGYNPSDLKRLHLENAGRYRIRVSAYGFQSKGRPVTMQLLAHRYRAPRVLGTFEMPADKPRVVEVVARLGANEILKVHPRDSGYDDAGKTIWNVDAAEFTGSGLAVEWVEVEGPLEEQWPPASAHVVLGAAEIRPLPKEKVRRWPPESPAYGAVTDDPKATARAALAEFLPRAFRREVNPDSLALYAGIAERELANGRPFEDAMRVAFRAALTAPQFLFLREKPGPLDGPALAARLSYFLWSAPPDAELTRLAESGELLKTDVLRRQAERLLADARSAAFVEGFTGQWLDLDKIAATSPDQNLYPEFDDTLGPAMVGETHAYFRELLRNDLGVRYFVDGDFLMLNRRMAKHYGVAGDFTEVFVRTPKPAGSVRGGLLTQASVLKVTANGTVTSPVLRGAWTLRRLLGEEPPPPPAAVGAIEPDTRGATTVRQLLDKHRNNDSCVACHRRIDPPGFALEAFDPIGGERQRYRSLGKGDPANTVVRGHGVWTYKLGPKVDCTGQTVDGRAFAGPAEFKKLLLADDPKIARAFAERLVVYATGAPVHFVDRAAVQAIVDETAARDHGVKSMILATVRSPLFRNK